jgi:hypothetical protein
MATVTPTTSPMDIGGVFWIVDPADHDGLAPVGASEGVGSRRTYFWLWVSQLTYRDGVVHSSRHNLAACRAEVHWNGILRTVSTSLASGAVVHVILRSAEPILEHRVVDERSKDFCTSIIEAGPTVGHPFASYLSPVQARSTPFSSYVGTYI